MLLKKLANSFPRVSLPCPFFTLYLNFTFSSLVDCPFSVQLRDFNTEGFELVCISYLRQVKNNVIRVHMLDSGCQVIPIFLLLLHNLSLFDTSFMLVAVVLYIHCADEVLVAL